jgi:signal transduction histidine kinase/phage shock protein PspC (stress-responsive transcriptional regulator)
VADQRLFGGVCRGLALHLGVDVWLLRGLFAGFALLGGAGVMAYAAFWVLVPLGRPAPEEWSVPRPYLRNLLLIATGVGAILSLGVLGSARLDRWGLILPALAVGGGLVVLWRQADDEQRARFFSAGHPPRTIDLGRATLGAMMVLGGITALVSAGTPWDQVWRTALAAFALLLGALLIALPFGMRLFRDLSAERAARVRSQERAEVAAMMHDSVLHTLTLIQRGSTDATLVSRLARAQERELRAWLYGDRAASVDRLLVAVRAAVAEVEDRHGATIEVVAVGDAQLDEPSRAMVAALREALINAAKYAPDQPISVFVEVGPQLTEVFVRDRGPGFDLDAVPADRMGIRESIIGRMERIGGRATIRTAPGEGTEVRLALPGERKVTDG